MEARSHLADNGDGWKLALKQCFDVCKLNKSLNPVVIVPGYGMNAFIFGYHPRGMSLEEYLASRGFEVWSVNLRGQGGSVDLRGAGGEYGFEDVCLTDLPAIIGYVLQKTVTGQPRVDLLGCSLGGTYVYGCCAMNGCARVGSIVGLGAPLRWEQVHPALAVAFGSRAVASLLKMKNTRRLAEIGLPIISKFPKLLSIYLHPEIVDLSRASVLAQTVEDPNSTLNVEICDWIKSKDLYIKGVNVTVEMKKVDRPLLVIMANADGIVPPKTALTPLAAVGSRVKEAYTAGSDKIKMAHADCYISDYAQELVFKPLADWLTKQSQ